MNCAEERKNTLPYLTDRLPSNKFASTRQTRRLCAQCATLWTTAESITVRIIHV